MPLLSTSSAINTMDLSLEFPGSYPDPSTKGLVLEKPRALQESAPALMPAGILSGRSAPEPYELGICCFACSKFSHFPSFNSRALVLWLSDALYTSQIQGWHRGQLRKKNVFYSLHYSDELGESDPSCSSQDDPRHFWEKKSVIFIKGFLLCLKPPRTFLPL